MKSLFKMEDVVRDILSWNPNTRDDDFILIYEVYKVINPQMLSKRFDEILMLHKHYGLPSFESIRRTRQKVQQQNPNLRASEKMKDLRRINEEYYKYFSKERSENE